MIRRLLANGQPKPILRLVLAAGCSAALLVPGAGEEAIAAEQNRAVLVVDTGDQVKRVCVRFWEESISGAELLRRAEVDAALRPFAGKGVAVCSLCGVGCKTDDSCLTCDADGRFWAYSRAPAGTSGFRLSPVGASNTEVRNGDVEGWRWSRGTSPGHISVEEVCDGAAPPAASTQSTTTLTVSGGSSDGQQQSTATVGPDGTTVTTAAYLVQAPAAPRSSARRPGWTATTSSTNSSTSSTPSPLGTGTLTSPSGPDSAPTRTDPARDRQAAAPRRATQTEHLGGGAGVVAFGAILAGLLTWATWARRRRLREHRA